MQHIGNSARDQYAQITLSGITDYTITNGIGDLDTSLGSRHRVGGLPISTWDLRQGSSSSSTSQNYTDWGTFVNNWFHYRHHDTDRFEPQGTSGTITITDGTNDTNFATFDWDDIVQLTNGTALQIRALDFESQLAAPQDGTLHITITDGGNPIPAKLIQLHTNQTVDLNQNFLLCLLYTSPSPRDRQKSRMPSSA